MPMSPIERIPIFGLRAVVEEEAMAALGGISKRGTSTHIETRWKLAKSCAGG